MSEAKQYADMTVEELIDEALRYSSRISETDAVIELSKRAIHAVTLRDEVARLTRRAGDLEGRFKMVGKYMGNGRMQQAHDLVKDTIVAIYMTEPKQAALTPQGGKGGGA